MEIKQQIDRILKTRHEKASELQNQKNNVAELKTALRKVFALEQKGQFIKNEDLRKDFNRKLRSLELRETLRKVDALLREYDSVITRFGKDYISIATIGKERQGKSQFLQSVSRLSNEVIPAYQGTSCTGATSVIQNDYSIPEGQLRAVISYKKRDDLVTLVREYVRTISPSYHSEEIEFDQIEYLPLTDLADETGTDADKLTAFNHLSNIVNNFSSFCDCFDHSPETYTNPEEIKKVVAQNNGYSVDDPLCERYYKYLAVSRADINCRFFYDAGKIRLIDTIGIESTQAGVEQAMLDTVKNESDAAIVVTRPIADPQIRDLEIYRTLQKTFADKKPEKWLFYLVNHYKGHNDNTVQGFDNSISSWGLAGHMIVDCSDVEAVNNRFMKMVLDTLLGNLGEIDSIYLKQLAQKTDEMKAIAARLITAIDGMSEHTNMSGTIALQKGKECFNAMGVQLRNIVTQYYRIVNEPNNILWNSTQRILHNLDTDINPGADAIQNLANNNNVIGSDVWNYTLHYVRNEITRRFTAIDDELERENIRFKNSLVRVLYNNLSELLGDTGETDDDSVDLTAKLREMMGKILSGNDRYNQIYDAIVYLDNFEFNTRATIIRTVRSQLGIINPLCEEYANPEINFHASHCGPEIDFYLTSRLSLIEENLRHELMGLYNAPNKAFYAVAEEFYDKLTFAASDISDGKITMMADVWGYFFQDFSELIWKEQAKDSEVLNELVRDMKALKPMLEKCLA